MDDTWAYDVEAGQREQRVPVFAAGTYFGQFEEISPAKTKAGHPKLLLGLRVYSHHPSTVGVVSRNVNDHLTQQGHPYAVQLSAKCAVQISQALGLPLTGKLPLAGLQGQWIGVSLSDDVETIKLKDGK